MGYYWRGDERRFIIDELRLGTRLNDIALMLGRVPLRASPRQIGRRVSDFVHHHKSRDPDLRAAYEAWRAKRPRKPGPCYHPNAEQRAQAKRENAEAWPLIQARRREGYTATQIARTLGPGWTRGRVLGLIHRRRMRNGK